MLSSWCCPRVIAELLVELAAGGSRDWKSSRRIGIARPVAFEGHPGHKRDDHR